MNEKKTRIEELVKNREYKTADSELYKILLVETTAEKEQAELDIYCEELLQDKAALRIYKRLYKAVKKENQLAAKALQELPIYMQPDGSINEGIFTDYCIEKIAYRIVKSQGVDNELFYLYTNGVYKKASKNGAKGVILKLLPADKQRNAIAENVYKNLLAKSADGAIDFEEFDSDTSIINVKNGLLNIDTGKLTPHTQERLSSVQLNCNYREAAECPNFERFINDLMTKADGEVDIDGIKILQEFCGIVVSNFNIAEKLKASLWLYSSRGNSGKSVFINVISALLGSGNVTNMDVQRLADDKFATAQLYGKRLMATGDQTAEDVAYSSIFKALTGNDPIFAQFKGVQGFNFRFKGGILIGCNKLPYFNDDKGDHLYNRIVLLPCTHIVTDDKKDTNLYDKLVAELDGIFNWCLKGLKRLRSNNWRLTKSEYSTISMTEYRALSDTVFAYINEEIIQTDNPKEDRIPATELFDSYTKWCRMYERTAVGKKQFRPRLESIGIQFLKSGSIRYYVGIKYKEFKDCGQIAGREKQYFK